MKKEIIIISDLWGAKKSDWVSLLSNLLSPYYDITFYDSCMLDEVNINPYEERHIHGQFVKYGIKKACENLLIKETRPKIYIGCSVGGVIAWKAALLGLPIEKLITISSSRLRKEKKKPSCPIRMYFGVTDPYIPNMEWINSIGKDHVQILSGDHNIYKESNTITQIVDELTYLKGLNLSQNKNS